MSSLTEMLSGLEPDELDHFFHETDAEKIVELVATASDRELERLLCDDPVRSAAVGSVLARLHEYAVLERLVEVRGSVAFRLRTPRKGEETYLLLFERRELTVVPPPGSHEAGVPEVTITCGMLEFVRLVTGGANAALLHLANRLAIDGDELLALEVGGVFRVPGKDGVAVDPKSLDPVDVAVAIAKVKDSHLHAVMSGALREVVLTEVFRRLPDYVDREKARPHDLAVGFKIGGRADGGVDRYVVRLCGGQVSVERVDDAADGPDRDATIALSGAQFLKLVTGHLNPVTGVMRGQLKVRGDVRAALTFSGLMEIPSA